MLFHIEQVHSPENCPYGKGGSGSLHDASVDGVEVKGFYGSFMEHTIYLVVEANDIERVNQFLLPGMKVCTARITPVSEQPMPRVRLKRSAASVAPFRSSDVSLRRGAARVSTTSPRLHLGAARLRRTASTIEP